MKKNVSSSCITGSGGDLKKGFEIKSPALLDVYAELADYAFQQRPCILFGPPGSGKEFAARRYYEKFSESSSHDACPYVSLNCAGLPETLAVSELFGHVKGSFTDAHKDRQGLFQAAENGVLFLDEIGDLSHRVQAMLLRAVDEPYEGRMLGSTRGYSTKNVTVICATEQPRAGLRPSLLDRLGKQVFIPGLDRRPEDIPTAVGYFVLQALVKRRDIHTLMNMLFGVKARNSAGLRQSPELHSLAQRIARTLLPAVKSRTWPGNFRALRVAIDTAVIRSKARRADADGFVRDSVRYFKKHRETYSARPAGGKPERADGPEPAIADAVHGALEGIDTAEKEIISRFLTDSGSRSFKCRDDFAPALGGLSNRTAQDRLKRLVAAGVLVRDGSRYRVALPGAAPDTLGQIRQDGFLTLPPGADMPAVPGDDLEALTALLENSRGIFVAGGPAADQDGSRARSLGACLAKRFAVYFYRCDSSGLSGLFHLIDREVQKRNIADSPVLFEPEPDEPALQAAGLSGYAQALFRGPKPPVLILDNIDLVRSRAQSEALKAMLRYWRSTAFVLVGASAGNELIEPGGTGIVEYRLDCAA